MKIFNRTSISTVLGDRVVYRNLEPGDARLPGLTALRPSLGLPLDRIPRKSEADYAHVVVAILAEAQRQRGVARPIRRLLFVGDTRLLDGTAFINLCLAGDWRGMAFIGSEDARSPVVETLPGEAGETTLYLANRWAALADFDRFAAASGLTIDEEMAVVLDIDKTCLGARGRNGHVIDQARVQAVEATVAAVLGPAFDPHGFRAAYDLLICPEFHPFTTDNQDYVAYLCLIVSSGLLPLDLAVQEIRQGRWSSFLQFMEAIGRRDLPAGLAGVHGEIYARAAAGDPTPFKEFRRTEYRATIARFGQLPDSAPVAALLAEEIVITQEVLAAAQAWGSRGALLFGLSDKPDEAALPTPELAAQDYPPIHRAVTHAVGE